MGVFRKIGDWFSRKVNNHMANSAPRKATNEEALKTKEMQAKYKKWAGQSGTTDENKNDK